MAGRSRSCACPRTTPPRSTRFRPWAGRSASSSTSSGPRDQRRQPVPVLHWAPDGEWLAFAEKASEDAPARIVRLSLATLEKRPLTSPPPESMGDLQPQISPDGRLLAFVRSGARTWGNQDVWVQPVSGGEARRLTFGKYGGAAALSWTADGAEIVFSRPTSRREDGPGTAGGRGAPAGRGRGRECGRRLCPREPHGLRPEHDFVPDIWRLPRPGVSRSTDVPRSSSPPP